MKKVIALAQDVYRFGKFREFVSFAVWELYHKLGLFPKSEYLKFNNSEAIDLGTVTLSGSEFEGQLQRLLGQRGLRPTKCEHNWKLLYSTARGEIFGCLYPDDYVLYKSTDDGNTLVPVQRFQESIKSIFVSTRNSIFVCVKGAIYRSSDNGITFQKTLDLGSPISFFRFNNAMTETPDGDLLIGEYGNILERKGWRKLAYLYSSRDDGETWSVSDFLIRKGINKHIHIIKYSRLLDRLVLADGDNYKKLWISDSLDRFDYEQPNWNPVNRFHIQMGGYTSVVENDDRILFGTDYQGGTNFIVGTQDGRKFTKMIIPDPYRRSPIDNMVLRKSPYGQEIWANLPFSAPGTKCLLMYSADGGTSWTKVLEYSRRNHSVWLINSSSGIQSALYLSVQDQKNDSRLVYRIVDQQG